MRQHFSIKWWGKKTQYTSKTTNETTSTYFCIRCEELRRQRGDDEIRRVATIHVRNGQLLDDPHNLGHFFTPRTTGEQLAKEVNN